ncbi:hypothetical protein GGS21DRAFT_372301 [Xylaria nigripes]|nr:hypothetical protein GGS21DRAFT_372301 [Xylaria nigripes]
MHGTADTDELSRPSFSHGMQPNGTSPYASEQKDTSKARADWLEEAKIRLTQALETSYKELDIIVFIIEEMEQRSQTEITPTNAWMRQVELMRACREYAASHCHRLHERLNQVELWAHAKMIGQQVPEKAPEEWKRTDVEWQRWLGELASIHADQPRGNRGLPTSNATQDAVWGPLPHILSADVWWRGL